MGQIVVWGVVLASELINEILIIGFTDCKTNHLIHKLCDSEKICVLFANFGDSVSTSLCSSRQRHASTCQPFLRHKDLFTSASLIVIFYLSKVVKQ